jgi:hypothetical protein
MANITYLKNATEEKYNESALQYISERSSDVIETARILGISAGAIAGAMAEENTAYDNYDYALDLYAKSDIDPVVASVTLPVALAGGPVTVAAWLTLYAAELFGTTRTQNIRVKQRFDPVFQFYN